MEVCKIITMKGERCNKTATIEGFCGRHSKNLFNANDLLKEPYINPGKIKCRGRERNCIFIANSGTLCMLCWDLLYKTIKKNYPSMLEIVKTFAYLMHKEDLFITKFTHLIEDWDFDKNIDFEIRTVSYGAHKKINWKCKEGHTWISTLNARTNGGQHTGLGTVCKECNINSTSPDRTAIETRRIKAFNEKDDEDIKNEKNKNTQMGDESEQYITDLLLESKLFKNVEKLGYLSGDSDICITHFDDSINYIQVKTLSKRQEQNDAYYFLIQGKIYPDNMLIVGINNEKTRFISLFKKDIKEKNNVSITFTSERKMNNIYKNFGFQSKEKLLEKLIEQIPHSVNEIKFSESVQKEFDSLKRLKEYCINNKLKFENHNTNTDTIDCFINGFRIQCKYTSLNAVDSVIYNVSFAKSCGYRLKRCYDENDFDFVILEVGGTKKGQIILEKNKYKGNFCIIPMSALKEKGHITTNGKDGKQNIRLCPPDYHKEHWTKEYWNRFDLLKS